MSLHSHAHRNMKPQTNAADCSAAPKSIRSILQSTTPPEVWSAWCQLQDRIAQDRANPLRRAIEAATSIRPWSRELMASGRGSTIRGRLNLAARGVRLLVSSMLPSQPLSVERQANQAADTLRAMKRSLHALDSVLVARPGVACGAMPNGRGERRPENPAQPKS